MHSLPTNYAGLTAFAAVKRGTKGRYITGIIPHDYRNYMFATLQCNACIIELTEPFTPYGAVCTTMLRSFWQYDQLNIKKQLGNTEA